MYHVPGIRQWVIRGISISRGDMYGVCIRRLAPGTRGWVIHRMDGYGVSVSVEVVEVIRCTS